MSTVLNYIKYFFSSQNSAPSLYTTVVLSVLKSGKKRETGNKSTIFKSSFLEVALPRGSPTVTYKLAVTNRAIQSSENFITTII